MKLKCAVLLMLAVLAGCNHYHQGEYRGIHNPGTIPCSASPPNQPGCY